MARSISMKRNKERRGNQVKTRVPQFQRRPAPRPICPTTAFLFETLAVGTDICSAAPEAWNRRFSTPFTLFVMAITYENRLDMQVVSCEHYEESTSRLSNIRSPAVWAMSRVEASWAGWPWSALESGNAQRMV